LFQYSFLSELLSLKVQVPPPISSFTKKKSVPSIIPQVRSIAGPRVILSMNAIPWLTFGVLWLYSLIETASAPSYAMAIVVVVALFWSKSRRIFLSFVAPLALRKKATSSTSTTSDAGTGGKGISLGGFSQSVSNYVWLHVDESMTVVPAIWVGGTILWNLLDYLAVIGTFCCCAVVVLFAMTFLDHYNGGMNTETGSTTAIPLRFGMVCLAVAIVMWCVSQVVNVDPREQVLKTNWYIMVLFILPPVAFSRCKRDAKLLWTTLKP